jgi:hypothetical protein
MSDNLVELLSALNITETQPSINVNTSKIILIQCIIRGWISRKNNIYKCLSDERVKINFNASIQGYHLLNTTPIKEGVWEDINCQILNGICNIQDCANGNHKSGKDNRFNNWDISNKTNKIEGSKSSIKISSYRLTSVCSDKNNGIISSIVEEIEKRDKSFHYYSILFRYENNNEIKYIWCIIPKDHYVFNVNKYEFTHKIGKRGRNKNEIIGWESKYMDITFSMSSQLWYNFALTDIEKYIICETTVERINPTVSYADIYNNSINNKHIN